MENTNKDESALQAFDHLDLVSPGVGIDWNKLHKSVIHVRIDAWRGVRVKWGDNFVKILTHEDDQGNTAIALAMRYSQEKVASILGIFDSKEVMELLLSTSRDQSVAQIIYTRHGTSTFMEVLLQQSNNKSVWAEMSQQTGCLVTIMKVFSEGELEGFLRAGEGDHLVLVSHVLNSCDALEALSYLQDSLGMDTVLDIILRKNNENVLVITAMSDECMKYHLPKFMKECRDRLEVKKDGLNGLHYILMSLFASSAFPLMITQYGKQESKELLLDQNTEGKTVLSLGLKQWSADCFASVMENFDKKEIVELLHSKDSTNSTMYDIVNSENAIGFMKSLIDCQLEVGNFVSALLCTEETKEYPLEAIVTWLNEIASDPKSVPALLKRMRWTVDQVKNKCYPLMSQPSILVISIRVGRERGAIEESESLIKGFRTDLSLNVTEKYDLTAEEIFEAITDQHGKPESKSCQIVVIMSHGNLGCIYDKNRHRIEIQQLVEKMTPVTHDNYPKVLILQCCQSNFGSEIAGNYGFKEDVNSTNYDDDNRSEIGMSDPQIRQSSPPYDRPRVPEEQPRHRPLSPFVHLRKQCSVVISCVPGERSFRNKFIPRMAAALRKLKSNEDLYSAYVHAHQTLNIPDQTPIFHSTMKLHICLRNVYPSCQEEMPKGEHFKL